MAQTGIMGARKQSQFPPGEDCFAALAMTTRQTKPNLDKIACLGGRWPAEHVAALLARLRRERCHRKTY